MHRPAVCTIAIRILLLPCLYVAYTFAIWFFPTQSPVHVSAIPAEGQQQVINRAYTGREVWLNYACQTCHSIYGLGGHLGPDLTNTASEGMGAYIRIVVREGRLGMPAFNLTERELDDLMAYLEMINASGHYPPRSLNDSVFGAVR